MSPDIDEKAIRHADAKTLTLLISRAKADALVDKVTEPSLLICSDQVIVHNGVIREKPVTADECREYLRSYEHSPAVCVVSVVVVNTLTGKRVEGTDIATQHFNKIPEHAIEALIAQGDVMHCAGGFTVEHMEEYTNRLEGEIECVTGLPKTLTVKLLEEAKRV
ncbi:maf family protein [Cavenderia fasciculata]|uniref:Maf family protein n=1 Tax=Cavenderia fasciculata TaxID=261658 RepID=F4PLI2_CACFS|nr:maf family protein [Cavenderia fasciculata]EGG23404.1 maf family protein [Cavenderia fasciculata]|eukprot:XP_004361255.1 maf family protein [Cavenderia fasciculata]